VGLFPEGYVQYSAPSTIADLEEIIRQKDSKGTYNVAYQLVSAVDVSNAEAMARNLVLIFEKDDAVLDLIYAMIDHEVESTLNEGTLFRKNSLASHLMSQYARLLVQDYLCTTLRPLIRTIMKQGNTFEVDPHKVDNEANLERNRQTLARTTQDFLLSMMESVNKFPISLRRMCGYLKEKTVTRFPEAKRKVVGGFFFLRLLCPAVVSPEGFGVIDQVDDSTRRALILVSKILQTLSNGVTFGNKEEYMMEMNVFIKENLENSHYILDKLSSAHPDIPGNRLARSKEEDKLLANNLHAICAGCKTKFLRLLRETGASPDELQHLASVIVRLGPTPKKMPKPAPLRGAPIDVTPAPKEDPATEKKRLKAAEKERKVREKEERKVREREEKRKAAESSVLLPPSGGILVQSFLSKKQSGMKTWKKKYFALFAGSTKIYVFNGPDDVPHSYQNNAIELAPSYEVTLIGRTKAGWEFSIRTLEREHCFMSSQEDDMRSWVAYLDSKKKEILMPENDKKEKLKLLSALLAKMKQYDNDAEDLKSKLKGTSDPDEIASLNRRVEELMICRDDVKRAISNAKESIRT